MGYFKGLVDINFKIDDKGRTLFYPWGVLGRGYIVPNKSKEHQIKRFKIIYHIISIPCMSFIAVAILAGWTKGLIFVFIFPLCYYLGTVLLLKWLPIVSDTKLGIKESYINSSKSHSAITLWLMLICSVLLIFAGIIVIVFDKTAWLIGSICILFFGVCACVVGYMIKTRKTP